VEGDSVKHRFSDVQSIRGAHNAPGTGFYLYDSQGQPSVSFVFEDQQTAADALQKMRNALTGAVYVENLPRI
jgi:hypothetical protein